MKIFGSNPNVAASVAATFRLRVSAVAAPDRMRGRSLKAAATSRVTCRAFTMVEVAISLAIIGVALVAIIGVLPLGMRTQRDNREETVINQDATVFMEAIRNGQFGLNELTNYVYAITNYWQAFGPNGQAGQHGVDGYSYSGSRVTPKPPPMNKPVSPNSSPLTNGLRIVGLMSMPEFLDLGWHPTNNMFSGGLSNHVVAYVRSLSGPAIEKPPQDNEIIVGDAFAYRIVCVNAPVAMDTNTFTLTSFQPNQPPYSAALAAGLHELRLTFRWPQLPSGNLGPGHHSFRTMVAGQITQIVTNNQWLYFYQPQSFTNLVSAQ